MHPNGGPGRSPMTRLGSVLLAAVVVFFAGCASMQAVPSAPIDGVSALAGTWTRAGTPGDWGGAGPLKFPDTAGGGPPPPRGLHTAWGGGDPSRRRAQVR